MTVALVCERFDRWPESLGVSPEALAESLAREGCAVQVVCDCVQRLDPPRGVTVHSMRGERWRIARRPEFFRAWAIAHPALRECETVISVCPGVEAPLWAPGVNWGRRAVLDEWRRTGLYTAGKRAAQWLLPRTRTARVARKTLLRRSAPTAIRLLAPDPAHAHRLASLTGTPRERIAIIGRFSGAATIPDRAAARAQARGTLGIDASSRVALLAIDRSSSPAVCRWLSALRDTGSSAPRVLLLTGGKMMATLGRDRDVAGCRVIGLGRTERFESLACACDAVIVPSSPAGLLDDSIAADALHLGLPLIAERGAPGALGTGPGVDELARRFPARVCRAPANTDEPSHRARAAALSLAFSLAAAPIDELGVGHLARTLLSLARDSRSQSNGPGPV